jgi:Mrp family chromosome partitioning ATPase
VPENRSLVRSVDAAEASPENRPSTLVPFEQNKGLQFVEFSPQPPFDNRLVFTDQDPARLAAFRILRHKLMDRGDARAILCTSPGPGEGKTTLAANLALAFSELGRYRVLLLEANFRPPSLGALFGFTPPEGFRRQIDRHHAVPDSPWVIIQIGPPPLYILAAEGNGCPSCGAVLPDEARFCGSCGAVLDQGSSFLDGAGFTDALQRFKRAFDYLIIDAPSVLVGGDINLIQDAADGVVMAVRRGQSDQRSLRRAIAQVAPTPVLAVTFFEE